MYRRDVHLAFVEAMQYSISNGVGRQPSTQDCPVQLQTDRAFPLCEFLWPRHRDRLGKGLSW